MKWFLCVFALFLVVPVFAQAQQPPTIAVIDVQRVVQQSEVGKKALNDIKLYKDQKQKEIDQRQDAIQGMQDKLDKQKDILSPDAQDKLRSDINKSMTDLRRFQEDSSTDIQNRLNDALENMEKQVLPIIQKLGTDRGYTIIISKDALIYYNGKSDVTDDVIRLFNESVAKPQTQKQ